MSKPYLCTLYKKTYTRRRKDEYDQISLCWGCDCLVVRNLKTKEQYCCFQNRSEWLDLPYNKGFESGYIKSHERSLR